MKKISNSIGKMAMLVGMLFTKELEAQKDSLSKSLITSNDTIKPIIHEEVLIGIRIEQHTEFEGGFKALYKFISDNLRYPDENCVTGTVYVGFIIDSVGNVKNVEVKRGLKGLPQYDEEAV